MVWPMKTAAQKEEEKAKKAAELREKERVAELVAAHPSARFPPTQVFYADPSFPEPPPLNYSLKTRYKSIAMFWGLIVVDCVAVPLILYFLLWYKTTLKHNAIFSISTGTLGTVSIVEYFLRFHRLWKKNSNCRVIGARRYYLDFFHWNLSVAWIAVMIELIVGTIPKYPPILLLAMPVTSMAYAFGVQMLIIDILRYFQVPAPIRISSLPRGSPLRPGIYSIIEDVCAVDGSGGTEFRQRLNLRYLSSHYFRRMLHRLTLFWAFGALGIAIITTVLIFTVKREVTDAERKAATRDREVEYREREVAYVIGWTLPFIWAGVWALLTTIYVKKSLKIEREAWRAERAKA